MDSIITNYSARKIFYVISCSILAVLLLIRFYVVPELLIWQSTVEILNSVIDNLLASFFVTIVVASFYFWLREKTNDQKFELIPSMSIAHELTRCKLKTDFWYYSGGTGRYTRSVTIPELARFARENNEHKFIKVELLDPTNSKSCEDYANYRSSLKSAKGKSVWSTSSVIHEAYATILACAVWKTEEPLLEFNVALKNNYSLFRIDMGQSCVLVTREDPREPAILASSDTLLYKFYKDEFHQTFRQARSIQIPLKFVHFHELNESNVTQLFKDLNIYSGHEKLDIGRIMDLVKKSENPYD